MQMSLQKAEAKAHVSFPNPSLMMIDEAAAIEAKASPDEAAAIEAKASPGPEMMQHDHEPEHTQAQAQAQAQEDIELEPITEEKHQGGKIDT